jgi:hypothetical protein
MSEAKKDESNLSALLGAESKKEHQTVVRVVTTSWMDSKGLHTKRSLNVLKRKSFGFNILEGECSSVGAENAVGNIINLQDVLDGIYEVVVCNASRDFETGFVDDWELKLVPFGE